MPVKNQKAAKQEYFKTVKAALPGIIIGSILTAASLCVTALVYLKINSYAKPLFYVGYVLIGVSAFICGYLTEKKIKGRGITVGGVAGIALSILTVVIVAFFGEFKIGLNILILIAVQTALSSIGGILAVNSKKRY